jgi:hypothetical protein
LAAAVAATATAAAREATARDLRAFVRGYPERIVAHEEARINEAAAEVASAGVVTRYGDKMMGVWHDVLESDEERVAIFKSLDRMGWGGHPSFTDAYYSFPARDEPEFILLWAQAVIEKAQEVFSDSAQMKAVMDRLGKAKTFALFPARATSGRGADLVFVQSLALAESQVVLMATDADTGVEWVVKYAGDVEDEMRNYAALAEAGGATPAFRSEYEVWGLRVLVVERLQPLSADDDEYDIVAQILVTQMKYLHRLGVHADVKPDNILKRATAQGPQYFLIDHDWSTERMADGFHRRLYTPLFASQDSDTPNVVTWWHDVLELLYAANAVALMRQRRNGVGLWAARRPFGALGLANLLSRASPEDAAWMRSDAFVDPQAFLGGAAAESRNNRTRWRAVSILLKNFPTRTRVNRPAGLVVAGTRLLQTPKAHPAPESIYDEIADLVRRPYPRDRAGFQPGAPAPPRVGAPFVGADLACAGCGRLAHKLRRGLFRTDERDALVVCGTRCQAYVAQRVVGAPAPAVAVGFDLTTVALPWPVALPWAETSQTPVQWNEWHFDNALADRAPHEGVRRLIASSTFRVGDAPATPATLYARPGFTLRDARAAALALGIDTDVVPLERLLVGMETERREHGREAPGARGVLDVTHDDPIVTAMIAASHFSEIPGCPRAGLPDYYVRLEEMEAAAERARGRCLKPSIFRDAQT